MARFVIQRRVVTGERTHPVGPDDALISDYWRHEMAARFREKDLGVVIKAVRAKTVQSVTAQYDALKARANTFNAQDGKFTEAQFIANALRVA